MSDFNLKDISRRMDGALQSFKDELAGLRTGRASTALLDPVVVEVYGTKMPINQVATVGAPEARLLTVQVWDNDNVKAVEKAIINAGLGLNPQSEGQLVRIPLPDLNEERRKELCKVAGKYAEQARVSVRNVRRDGMDQIKKLKNDGDMSEDEMKAESENIQQETDKYVAEIDETLKAKEQEIMQV